MGKRKNSSDENSPKKVKIEPESVENGNFQALTKQPGSASKNKENCPWSYSDKLELISKIEENIPKDDPLSYHTRLEKIVWDKITIKGRSKEECQEVWSGLLAQVRKFRHLKEIIEDMKLCLIKPKTKATKYPDKPKQSLNSFMLFTEEKRKDVMKEYPNLPAQDIAKKLGQLFKNLDPAEREKYDLLANLAKEEYTEQLRKYYERHPDLMPKKDRKRRKTAIVVLEGERDDRPPKKEIEETEEFVKIEAKEEFPEIDPVEELTESSHASLFANCPMIERCEDFLSIVSEPTTEDGDA